MEIILGLAVLLIGVSAGPLAEREIPAAEPEYLDHLLATKQYDEFNKLMGIDIPHLSHPRDESSSADPNFNDGLFFGDILLTSEQTEQARQGIRFDKYRGSKWETKVVPYTISSQFTSANRARIDTAIKNWNQQNPCIQWRPRKSETAYVNYFPGNGCFANLGRTGRQQSLSLAQNGCMREGTILHEMDHAIGFAHEHNRSDRDNFIQILWENIPEEWKSQYEKTNPNDFGLQSNYDYYSVMHYPVGAPGTNGKPAFKVLKSGIDERRIGQRVGFTDTDKEKIRIQYC